MPIELESYKKFLLKRFRRSLLIGGLPMALFLAFVIIMPGIGYDQPISVMDVIVCTGITIAFLDLFIVGVPDADCIVHYIRCILCYKCGECYRIGEYGNYEEQPWYLFVLPPIVDTKNRQPNAKLLLWYRYEFDCNCSNPCVFVIHNLRHHPSWEDNPKITYDQATLFIDGKLYRHRRCWDYLSQVDYRYEETNIYH